LLLLSFRLHSSMQMEIKNGALFILYPAAECSTEWPNVSKCSRVIATTSDDFSYVSIERQIFVEYETQQLDGRTECNFRTSDVDSS